MSSDYATLAVFFVAGVALSFLLLVFVPRQAAGAGSEPFESGLRSERKTWVQFRVRYFVLALVFVSFDMEMVFMFPRSVVFKRLGLSAFVDMLVFIAILAVAIAFAWKRARSSGRTDRPARVVSSWPGLLPCGRQLLLA